MPGYEIQLVTQDVPLDQAKLGPAAFRHLTEVEKVDVVIGPLGSNVSLAVEPLVDSLKVPTIVHTASALAVTEDNDFIFRMWPTADSYAQEILDTLDEQGVKKIGIITSNSDNLIDLKNILEERFIEDGGDIVSTELVALDTNDFRTVLAKLKSEDFEMLFLNLFVGQIGNAAKQARELGIEQPFFGNAVMAETEVEIGGSALENMWFPNFVGYTNDFKQKVVAELGKEPSNSDSFAAAHDALVVFMNAIREVGKNPDKVIQYIYKNEFKGSVGDFTFAENGDALISLGLFVVQDEKIVPMTSDLFSR